jgi:small subunit ribosomal protein S21
MIIVEVKNGNIELALKKYKAKINKIKQNKELKNRKEFIKPSIVKRDIIKRAQYIQKLNNN